MSSSVHALENAARTRDLHRVTTEESLFSSEYNVPPGHAMGPKDSVRWTLRGYLPPKHLRIPGYNYGVPEDSQVNSFFESAAPVILARESIAELMAGCYVPDADVGREDGMSDNSDDSQVDPMSRTVKGKMSSRPSWGQHTYEQAQAQAPSPGVQSVAV